MKKEFNWGPGSFLIIYQVILLIALPIYLYYSLPSWQVIVAAIILLYATGLSITAGYHRYFSHRSYKTHPWVETVILFFSSMAVQGSALRWSFDHRRHHAHVDTDQDPYSIKKGFWYAHFLWLLERPEPIDSKVVSDLIKNPRVMFQHRHAIALMIATNAAVCLLVGWMFNDYWGAFFIATWLRMLALHHFTWFINSLAHTWGDRPFSQEQSAVDNYIISLLTFGEGYHNYHHTYANDYRNGVRWYHFDPTKWLIWGLSKIGLAENLKKIDAETIGKRMLIERKQMLLEKLRSAQNVEWEAKIHSAAEVILEKIAALSEIKKQYESFKKDVADNEYLKELKSNIRHLKMSLKNEWRSWKKLTQEIESLQT